MVKVSIITPCYNAALYITRTINSVQNQTISDWEMIVIDDGSTDNSAEIVKTIAKEDPRIKLFQKENGGSASNLINVIPFSERVTKSSSIL